MITCSESLQLNHELFWYIHYGLKALEDKSAKNAIYFIDVLLRVPVKT